MAQWQRALGGEQAAEICAHAPPFFEVLNQLVELVQHQGSSLDEQMSFPHFPGLRSWEIYSGDQSNCPHVLSIAVSARTANEDTAVKIKS